MPGGQGAMVQGVMAGGPAAVAGLKPPDVIQTLDGEAVTSYEAFVGRIREMTPGTEVRLGVWRDGRQVEIRAQVGDTRKLPAVSQDVTASPGAVAPGSRDNHARPGPADFADRRAEHGDGGGRGRRAGGIGGAGQSGGGQDPVWRPHHEGEWGRGGESGGVQPRGD